MSLWRTIKPESLTHMVENGHHSLKDTIDKWSSIPNASIGKSVEKSVKQAIQDGGVKGHSEIYKRKGKDIGMEITTKKGRRTQIKELVAVKDERPSRIIRTRNNNKAR